MIVTVDGPAGSGKSSVADFVAGQLGFHHMQTGLLYRAVAYLLKKTYRTDFEDFIKKHEVQENLVELLGNIEYVVAEDNRARILVGGKDVTETLLRAEFDQPASVVSAIPSVRKALLPIQRVAGQRRDVIAEGRDCGSVVFPDADLKIFLTASAEKRALRIMKDPKRCGQKTTFELVLEEVLRRDERDRTRKIAPLVVPNGAVVIDNSTMSLEESIEVVLRTILLYRR